MARRALFYWYALHCLEVWAVRLRRNSDTIHRRSLEGNRSALQDASPAELSGRFRVQNRASVPVNLMILSSAVWAHAAVENGMFPGGQEDLATYLVWYDMHLTISDENEWSRGKEVSWGLLKDVVSTGVSHVVNAGVTGKVAIHAGIAVATALTAVVAPPVAIAAGIIAGGAAGAATALAVSQLTEASFELSRDALNVLLRESKELPKSERVRDGMFRFCQVVKELDVRAAFVESLKIEGQKFVDEDPKKALRNIVMTQATAEAYYAALHAKFSTSKLATTEERPLEILGGFTLPSAHASDSNLQVVEFTPLHVREVELGYGCEVTQASEHWKEKYDGCESHCQGLDLKERRLQQCIAECQSLLQAPMEAEMEIYGENGLRAKIRQQIGMVKAKVKVSTDASLILRASRAAGLSSDGKDDKRLSYSGARVEVRTWSSSDFTASVFLGLTGDYIETPDYVRFPLEVLANEDDGFVVFTEAHRVMLQSLRYGECWSRSGSNSLWNNTRSVFSGGAWCYASDNVPGRWCKDAKKPCPFHFGRVCLPNANRCALVKEDPSWYCIGR